MLPLQQAHQQLVLYLVLNLLLRAVYLVNQLHLVVQQEVQVYSGMLLQQSLLVVLVEPLHLVLQQRKPPQPPNQLLVV